MPLNPPIVDWKSQVVWLIGASSGIGEATAALLYRKGASVVVSARNQASLDAFVTSHPEAMAKALDVTDATALVQAAQQIAERLGRIDTVIFCAGHYKAQDALHFDLAEMLLHQNINYVGALNMLAAVLPRLVASQSGHICLISSVAGYRGLPKALAYGPTKAALQNLADGLYLDLHSSHIGVSVVNPGFVKTALTAQNDFTMPALLSPDQAAQHIVAGLEGGKFEIHFPKRFTLWLKLLRILPHRWYFWLVRMVTV